MACFLNSYNDVIKSMAEVVPLTIKLFQTFDVFAVLQIHIAVLCKQQGEVRTKVCRKCELGLPIAECSAISAIDQRDTGAGSTSGDIAENRTAKAYSASQN